MAFRSSRISGIFLILTVVAAIPALAAATSINGKVVDENGAPIPGVRVSAFDPSPIKTPSTPRAATTSDAAGIFRLDIPAAGLFDVRAEHDGFFLFQNRNVNLDPDSPLEIRLNHVKELAESVDVRYS